MSDKNYNLSRTCNLGKMSGWPSGLRRQSQVQNLSCLFRAQGRSGPRMWAWVRIPLLTKMFLLSLEICRFCGGSMTISAFPSGSNENLFMPFKDEGNRLRIAH